MRGQVPSFDGGGGCRLLPPALPFHRKLFEPEWRGLRLTVFYCYHPPLQQLGEYVGARRAADLGLGGPVCVAIRYAGNWQGRWWCGGSPAPLYLHIWSWRPIFPAYLQGLGFRVNVNCRGRRVKPSLGLELWETNPQFTCNTWSLRPDFPAYLQG